MEAAVICWLMSQEVSKQTRENLETALEAKEDAIRELKSALAERESGLEDALMQHQELTKMSNKSVEELKRRHVKVSTHRHTECRLLTLVASYSKPYREAGVQPFSVIGLWSSMFLIPWNSVG